MENINIGKAHWAAIVFWIGALFYEFFGKNNFDLLFSLLLLIMASLTWYIFVADNTRKMQKPLQEIRGYRRLFIMSSLILMIAVYYILFARHELIGAIITAWIGNISMAAAAVLTYFEVKRSSD